MNYYEARQRTEGGKFDFTCANDGRIWPVGYCRSWERLEKLAGGGENQSWLDKYKPFKDKFHGDGHDTAEEAEECYFRYCLDHEIRTFESTSAHKCRICDEWTPHHVELRHSQMLAICPEHQSRENYEKLFQRSSKICSSY